MDIKLDKDKRIVIIIGETNIKFVEDILDEYNVNYKKRWRSKKIECSVLEYEPVASQYYNTEYVISVDNTVNRKQIFSFYLIKGLIEGLSKVQIEEDKKSD